MARTLYIVRHGNTFDRGDTVTRVGARTDLPLSVSGREQAERLAAHFRDKNTKFNQALAGPLKRTVETAEAILAAQADAPKLEITAFLREIDYGPDENQPEEKVIARLGEDALADWERAAIPPAGWNVDPAELEEAWRALFRRLGADTDEGPVLLVTSNGIARFALMAAHGGQDQDLKLKTGAYGVLSLDDAGTARVSSWNIRP